MAKSERKKPVAQKGQSRTELTGLETEIMQVVWERGTVTAADVRRALEPARPLAATTVITVLEKLRKKKAVRAVPTTDRSRKYRASVPKEAVAERLVRGLLGRFFGDSPASLVAHLMKTQEIDHEELDEIRKALDDSKAEGEER